MAASDGSMTDEQVTVLAIKGAISELDAKTRADIVEVIDQIKALHATYGEAAVGMAIVLLSAEMAAA